MQALNNTQSQEILYEVYLNSNNVKNMLVYIYQNATVQYTREPFVTHMQGINEMQWQDDPMQKGDLIIYELQENESYIDYMQTGGQWFRLKAQSSWSNPVFMANELFTQLQEDRENNYSKVSLETEESLKVTASIPAVEIYGLLPFIELAVTNTAGLLETAPHIDIQITINKKSELPEKIVFDMTSCTNFIAQAEGGNITNYTLTFTYTGFDSLSGN